MKFLLIFNYSTLSTVSFTAGTNWICNPDFSELSVSTAPALSHRKKNVSQPLSLVIFFPLLLYHQAIAFVQFCGRILVSQSLTMIINALIHRCFPFLCKNKSSESPFHNIQCLWKPCPVISNILSDSLIIDHIYLLKIK